MALPDWITKAYQLAIEDINKLHPDLKKASYQAALRWMPKKVKDNYDFDEEYGLK